ncbi:hypothetical protein [Actinocrispum wychmicini]|uniref:hypothetical protein n=1 Tax=Actinocrispum wychmicini TaxID=1213861 RepID=UPI0010439B1E|nr:hypothetical protein [Actinocrispum wychmicini]
MSTPAHPTGGTREWPTDTLTALRLGQRLVTEIRASRPGRRAFVDITPLITPADVEARSQGWDTSRLRPHLHTAVLGLRR